MGSQQRDIFAVSPPFLILHRNGSWKLVREIFPHNEGLGYIEPFAMENDGKPEVAVLSGSPWQVDEGVWELDYGIRIVSLNHPDYHLHPGWSLWTQWLRFLSEERPLTYH